MEDVDVTIDPLAGEEASAAEEPPGMKELRESISDLNKKLNAIQQSQDKGRGRLEQLEQKASQFDARLKQIEGVLSAMIRERQIARTPAPTDHVRAMAGM